MATYTDKLIVLTEGKLQKVNSGDTIEFTGTLSFTGTTTLATLDVTGDASVGGDLTVEGDIVSKGQTNVLVEDAYIDLASGNTSASASSGGLTVNLKKATGFTALTTSSFTAGGGSAPTITMASVTGLSAGDIIQVSGAAEAGNNGLYAINSVSGSDLLLYGTGGTAIPSYARFCQTQVTTGSDAAASVVKVDLAVFAFSDGTLEGTEGMFALGTPCYVFAAGANLTDFDGGWSEFGGSVSLQNAYDSGPAIVLTDTNDLTVSKPTSGSAAISLEANAASSFTVDSADLTLETATSGALYLQSAGAADLQAAGALTIDSSGGAISIGSDADAEALNLGTGAAARTITLGNDTGATTVDVNTGTGGFTVDTTSGGVISLDAVGANINVTANGGAVEVSSLTSGNVTIAAADALDMDANGGDVTIDATGAVLVNAAVASNFSVDGANLTLSTTTSGDVFVDAAGNLDMDAGASGNVTIDAGGSFSIDSAVLSNITVTGDNLNISTATTGDLGLTAADDMTLDATAGNLYINATAGSLNIGDDAVAGAINIGTAGARTITIGNASATLVYDAASFDFDATGAITLDAGDASNFSIATTLAAQDLTLSVTGATDSSVVLSSSGTGADAIDLNATAGGITADAAGAISLDAGAASNFTVDAANLTLSTTTTGNVVVNSAGAVTIDAAAGGGVSIDAVGANANFTVATGNLTLSTTTAGAVTISAAASVDIDGAVGVSIDAAGATGVAINAAAGTIQIGNNADAYGINIGTGASARTITLGNATGATALDVNLGTGGMTVDTLAGGGISLDAVAAASNFSVDGGSLSLRTVTSGALDVTSAGVLDLDAASALSINSSAGAINIGNDVVNQNIAIGTAGTRTVSMGSASATLDLDAGSGGVTIDAASGAISLDAAAASNFSVTGAALSLKTLTSGALDVTSAGAMDIDAAGTLSINAAASQTLNIGNDLVAGEIYIGTGGSKALMLGSPNTDVSFGTGSASQAAGSIFLTAAGYDKGSVLYVSATTGKAAEADCDAAGKKDVVGVATETAADGNSSRVCTVAGTVVYTRFKTGDAPSSSADIGSPVYLSDSAGEAGLTPPTAGRVYRLGILLSNTASSGLYKILWQPQFVADL